MPKTPYPKPWEVTPWVRRGAFICLFLFFVAAPLTMVFVDRDLTLILARLPLDVVLFFDAITEIGNSRWYLFPSILLAGLLALAARIPTVSRSAARIWRWLAGASLFVFLSVLMTVGRARPKLFLNDGIFGFEPFILLEPQYNSFPSGHAQVSLCVALAFGCLFPKLRLWLFALALIIAVSRIALLVHFISDVMASVALSLPIFWCLRSWYRDKGYVFAPSPNGGWRLKPEGRWIATKISGRFFRGRSGNSP